jgi:hypothetical protein
VFVKQISVFLENREGRLAAVTELLGVNNINIRAFSVADTADFGILRLIVDNPDKACTALKESGFTVNMTDVVAVKVPDEPGGLAKILKMLNNENINIEYLYAFSEKTKRHALVIFRFEDFEMALRIFEKNGVSVAPSQEIYA